MLGCTILPFINSPNFGSGLGVLSMAQTPTGILSRVFGSQSFENVTESGLLNHRGEAEDDISSGEAEWRKLMRGESRDRTQRIAGIVRGLKREWMIFMHGTAVPLDPNVSTIASFKQFAGAFCGYPFHRVLEDPHKELMKCCLRTKAIFSDELRDKAFKAVRQLLNAGYPMPGCSDRYIFMPQDDVGVVWVVDDNIALGNCTYKRRDSTTEERSLVSGAFSESADRIPTIDDPTIDSRLARSPLTIVFLDLSKTPSVRRSDIYYGASEHGIEKRRLDYMFPLPIAWISSEGVVRSLH